MFVLRLVLIAQVLPAGLAVVFWSPFSDWWKGLVFSFYKDWMTQI